MTIQVKSLSKTFLARKTFPGIWGAIKGLFVAKKGRCRDPKVQKQIHSVVTMLVDYIDRHICPLIALENLVRKEKKGI